MSDYQKKPQFKKSFGKGPRRDFDGPKKLYKAQCSNCRETCEVPFRPNGMKPVFCRNCFQRDDARDSRDTRGSFGKKEFSPRREFAPRPPFQESPAPKPDPRIDDLGRKLTLLESKLDHLTRLVEASVSAPQPAQKKKAAAKKKTKKA